MEHETAKHGLAARLEHFLHAVVALPSEACQGRGHHVTVLEKLARQRGVSGR